MDALTATMPRLGGVFRLQGENLKLKRRRASSRLAVQMGLKDAAIPVGSGAFRFRALEFGGDWIGVGVIDNFRRTAKRAVFTVLITYWVLIFAGTHTPITSTPGGVRYNDKAMHFIAYSGLGFLLAWATLRLRPTWEGCVVVVLIIAGYGFADELSQTLIPHRSMEAMDWLADMCGGTFGLSLYFMSHRICMAWLSPACPRPALVQKDAA